MALADNLNAAATALVNENTTLQALIAQFQAEIPAEALPADVLAGTAHNLYISPADLVAALESGSLSSSALYAALKAFLAAAAPPPPIKLGLSSPIGASNAVNTMLNSLSGAGSADLTVSNNAVTVVVAGDYHIDFGVNSAGQTSNGGGAAIGVSAQLQVNGVSANTGAIDNWIPSAGVSAMQAASTSWTSWLNAGDVITFFSEVTVTNGFVSAQVQGAAISVGRIR